MLKNQGLLVNEDVKKLSSQKKLCEKYRFYKNLYF